MLSMTNERVLNLSKDQKKIQQQPHTVESKKNHQISIKSSQAIEDKVNCDCYAKIIEAGSKFAWPGLVLFIFIVMICKFKHEIIGLFERLNAAKFPGGGELSFEENAGKVAANTRSEETTELETPKGAPLQEPSYSEYCNLLKTKIAALKEFNFIPVMQVNRPLSRRSRKKLSPIMLDGGFSKDNKIIFVNVAVTKNKVDIKQKKLYDAVNVFKSRFPKLLAFGILVIVEGEGLESKETYCVAKMTIREGTLEMNDSEKVEERINSAFW